MTKSTITREQLEEWVAQLEEDGGCDATDRQLEALIRQSLAAMDSEPVAEVVSIYGDPEAFGEREIRPLVGIQQMPYGTKLYRHAQPAPEYPETLPCPVLLEPGLRFGKGIKTSTMLAALSRRSVYESDLAALSPEEKAEFQAGIEDVKALIAQPAPVVLEVMEPTIEAIKRILPTSNPDEYAACIGADMWNACRAAMLQAQSDDDGEPTDDERIMAIEGIHSCERCGDEGWVVGEMGITRCACGQAGNSPVIPDGSMAMLRRWLAFGRGMQNAGSQLPRNLIAETEEMLAAAPQLPGSEPATVPGKWIPVSERLPEDSGRYWCYVEEQNDPGKSHYQWNCSWNGDRWWVESEGGGIVTHWMQLPAGPQEVKGE